MTWCSRSGRRGRLRRRRPPGGRRDGTCRRVRGRDRRFLPARRDAERGPVLDAAVRLLGTDFAGLDELALSRPQVRTGWCSCPTTSRGAPQQTRRDGALQAAARHHGPGASRGPRSRCCAASPTASTRSTRARHAGRARPHESRRRPARRRSARSRPRCSACRDRAAAEGVPSRAARPGGRLGPAPGATGRRRGARRTRWRPSPRRPRPSAGGTPRLRKLTAEPPVRRRGGRAGRSPDPLAAYRDPLRRCRQPARLLRRQLLGRPLKVTGPPARAVSSRRWGGRLIPQLGRALVRPPAHGRRRPQADRPRRGPGRTAVGDSTTVLLYKLMRSAVAARPGAPAGHRPRQLPHRPLRRRRGRRGVRPHAAVDRRRSSGRRRPNASPRSSANRPALVVISQVAYRSAWLADVRAAGSPDASAGALVLWDLCHSAGSVPVALDDAGVDLAVRCTYKYLQRRPGAHPRSAVARLTWTR